MPIFKIKKDNTNNWFYPEYVREKYVVPNKIYGDLYKNAVMVWNTYIRDGKMYGVYVTTENTTKERIANIEKFVKDRSLENMSYIR